MAEQRDVLDDHTIALVALAAAIARGEESDLRERVDEAAEAGVPNIWIDELILQSTLMVGYPRTLIAASLWRDVAGVPAEQGDTDLDYREHEAWSRRGEETCHRVYGENYSKLRRNVATLHPALDVWMLTEGYGRTLSRPGLDLKRREFCVIVQTAVLNTPRQLHSHLRGALNADATFEEVEHVLSVANPLLSYDDWKAVKELWDHVQDAWNRLA